MKHKKLIKKISICAIALKALLTAGVFIYANSDPGPEFTLNKIKSNEIQYTHNCGWVDWGHVLPGGPAKLIDKVTKEKGISRKDSVDITYSQFMGHKIFDRMIHITTESTYRIKKGLDKETLEQIAYKMLKDVSMDFENLQGKPPLSWSPHIRKSSFAEEQLVSNHISFCAALYNIPSSRIKDLCDTLSVEKSINMFLEGEYGKQNKTWKPIYRNDGISSAPKFPEELKFPTRDVSDKYRKIEQRTYFGIRKHKK